MRIILIYDEVPERTKIWELTLLQQSDIDKAIAVHGKMENVDDMTDDEIKFTELLRQVASIHGRLLFDSELKAPQAPQRIVGEFLVIHIGFFV